MSTESGRSVMAPGRRPLKNSEVTEWRPPGCMYGFANSRGPATMTDRRRRFVALYLGEARCNAMAAARLAGYRWPRVAGPRLLTDAGVSALVDAHIARAEMDTVETLARLSAIARSDMGAFLRFGPDGRPRLDLAEARRLDKLGVVGRLRHRAWATAWGGSVEVVELELMDPTQTMAQPAK